MEPARKPPSLLHYTRGSLVVLVHGAEAPTMDDWRVYSASLHEAVKKDRACSLLVVTDGAGPSAVQRDHLAELVPPSLNSGLRTAVVTSSPVARGIVTVISWFQANIEAFAPAAIERAFAYLNVPVVERPLVLRTVAAMRAQLAGVGVFTDNEALAMLHETAVAPMDAVVARLGALRAELASRKRA